MMRTRERGTAAVELLLSIPFLMIFAIAMLDFAKGYSTRSQCARAARHVAWSAARAADLQTAAAPLPPAVHAAHLRDIHHSVTVEAVERDDIHIGIPGVGDLLAWLGDLRSKLTFTFMDTTVSLGDLGHGIFDFATGTVRVSRGTVSAKVPVNLNFFGRTMSKEAVRATHAVSLHSFRDPDASNPIGWFDPYHWILKKIDDLLPDKFLGIDIPTFG